MGALSAHALVRGVCDTGTSSAQPPSVAVADCSVPSRVVRKWCSGRSGT